MLTMKNNDNAHLPLVTQVRQYLHNNAQAACRTAYNQHIHSCCSLVNKTLVIFLMISGEPGESGELGELGEIAQAIFCQTFSLPSNCRKLLETGEYFKVSFEPSARKPSISRLSLNKLTTRSCNFLSK